jgi:hypothetical protein
VLTWAVYWGGYCFAILDSKVDKNYIQLITNLDSQIFAILDSRIFAFLKNCMKVFFYSVKSFKKNQNWKIVLLSRIAKLENCSAILYSNIFAFLDSNFFQSWINVPELNSF